MKFFAGNNIKLAAD